MYYYQWAKELNLPNYVPADKMCRDAMEGKYAVGQYNINNLEWIKNILLAAQATNSPVILGCSEGAAKYFGGYTAVTMTVLGVAKDLKITIPFAIHLDHGSSYEVCKIAMEAGFSSVMIDASKKPIEENCRIVKEVVELAKKHKVSVEAEVGIVGGEEDGVAGTSLYAKIEDVKAITRTGIDFLAAAYGSVHGHYTGEPKLGFDQMKEAREVAKIPLVLHGGSGIDDEKIKRAINCGQTKINVNTEFQEEFTKGIRHYIEQGLDKKEKGYDPRKVCKEAYENVYKAIITKIKLFGTTDKA